MPWSYRTSATTWADSVISASQSDANSAAQWRAIPPPTLCRTRRSPARPAAREEREVHLGLLGDEPERGPIGARAGPPVAEPVVGDDAAPRGPAQAGREVPPQRHASERVVEEDDGAREPLRLGQIGRRPGAREEAAPRMLDPLVMGGRSWTSPGRSSAGARSRGAQAPIERTLADRPREAPWTCMQDRSHGHRAPREVRMPSGPRPQRPGAPASYQRLSSARSSSVIWVALFSGICFSSAACW